MTLKACARRTMFQERACRRRGCRAAAHTPKPPAPEGQCLCGAVRNRPRWGQGFEGQRKAEPQKLGSLRKSDRSGGPSDPTILKDGKDYYSDTLIPILIPD